MKKTLMILSLFIAMTACKESKDKVENTTETTENQSEGTLGANGDETTQSENQDITGESEVSLVKNEDESYTFRYNLKKGQTYPFDLKISQTQTMSAGGRSMNLSSSRTVGFDYFVEEIIGNKFKLKATFKNFSESFKSPEGKNISYNTTSPKPSDKDVAQSWLIYKAITGQSFTMEVDNKGKVHSVTGLDKIVTNALSKLKNDFNADEQKEIKELLTVALSTEAIKSQFEESLNIFPDKSLKVGEKWEDTQNISEGPIKGQNKVTRTFDGINDGKAIILVKGVQDVGGKDTQSGITATMKNTATLDGKVELDVESGWIKKVNITKKENVNTTFQQGDQKETESGTQTIVTTVN